MFSFFLFSCKSCKKSCKQHPRNTPTTDRQRQGGCGVCYSNRGNTKRRTDPTPKGVNRLTLYKQGKRPRKNESGNPLSQKQDRKEKKMKNKKDKTTQRQIVTVAEAKKSEKKRSTVAPNIQYDRVTQKFIVEFYKGVRNGKAEREHKSFASLQEAKDALTRFKADKLNGLPENTSRKIAFGDCVEEFIRSAPIERTTERGYRVIQKRIQGTPLHERKLVDVRKCDIEDYINGMKRSKRFKNCTINKDLDLIQGVLKFAFEREYIGQNPALRVKKLKEEKFEIEPLSIDELKNMQALAIDTGDYALIVPIFLGGCQGMRRGEIVGLKWDMIAFDKNVIYIRNTITQMGGEIIHKPPKTTRSTRDLDILPSVKKVLIDCMEWQKKHGLYGEYVVVNSRGESINPTVLSKKFNAFLRKNDLREVRFHDLRHTYATCAISQGAPPSAVSGALGHSTLSTTLNIYTHTNGVDGSRQVNDFFKNIF